MASLQEMETSDLDAHRLKTYQSPTEPGMC